MQLSPPNDPDGLRCFPMFLMGVSKEIPKLDDVRVCVCVCAKTVRSTEQRTINAQPLPRGNSQGIWGDRTYLSALMYIYIYIYT